jgi:hypothetical protein
MIHRILFAGAIGVEAWLTGITYLHDTAAMKAGATLAVGAVFAVADVLLIAALCLRKWAKNRSWTTPTQTGRRR